MSNPDEEEIARRVMQQMQDDTVSDVGEENSDEESGFANVMGLGDIARETKNNLETKSEGAAGDVGESEDSPRRKSSFEKPRSKEDSDLKNQKTISLMDLNKSASSTPKRPQKKERLIQESDDEEENKKETEKARLEQEKIKLRREAEKDRRKKEEKKKEDEKPSERKTKTGENNTNQKSGKDEAQVRNQLLPTTQTLEKRTTHGNSIMNHFDLDEDEFGVEKFTYVSGDNKKKVDMSVQLNNSKNLSINYLASRTVEQFKKMSGTKTANDYANSIKSIALRLPIPIILLAYQGFKKYRIDDIEKGDELVDENNRKSRERTGRNDAVPQITYKANWETLKPYLITLQSRAQGRLTWSAIAICYETVFKSIRDSCLYVIPNQQRALYSKAYFVGSKLKDAVEECDLRLTFTAAILGKFFSRYNLSEDEISAIESPGSAFIPGKIGTANEAIAEGMKKVSLFNLRDLEDMIKFVNAQNVVDLIPALFIIDIKNVSSIKEFKTSMDERIKTRMFNYFQKVVRIAENIMRRSYGSKVFDRMGTWEEVREIYWQGMNILRKIIRGLKRGGSNRMRNNPRATTAAFNTASKANGGRGDIDALFKRF